MFQRINNLKLFIRTKNQLKTRNLKSEVESSKNVQVNEAEFREIESQKFVKKLKNE